jgi:hypothetical protein
MRDRLQAVPILGVAALVGWFLRAIVQSWQARLACALTVAKWGRMDVACKE